MFLSCLQYSVMFTALTKHCKREESVPHSTGDVFKYQRIIFVRQTWDSVMGVQIRLDLTVSYRQAVPNDSLKKGVRESLGVLWDTLQNVSLFSSLRLVFFVWNCLQLRKKLKQYEILTKCRDPWKMISIRSLLEAISKKYSTQNYIYVVWVENLSSLAQYIFPKLNCTINGTTNIVLVLLFILMKDKL